MQCVAANASLPKLEINFYDEPFQKKIESLSLHKANALNAAERCLSEALRRCRSVNLVELEPNLLLAWARLERQKAKGKKIKAMKQRRILIKWKNMSRRRSTSHLQKAKDYALDVSEISHLYQSTDPHFYDGIPECAMLKRGLTPQERIENGYWVAYQIAEALDERYKKVL